MHGDRRNDDYFWLRDRDDPRTLAYLRAENAYADAWFAPHAALKEQLYQEMFGRIQQDDDSVPYRKGLWWYSSRTQKGDQYPRYIRRRALGSERSYDPQGSDETMLDLNELARGQAFLRLGLATVTLDARLLAYTLDLTGGRDFTLHIRDLATGKDDAWTMPQVSSAEWANDGRTLYYVTMDQSKRSSKLWRHVVGASRRRCPGAGGEGRAVRPRHRQDPRRPLPGAVEREQGLERAERHGCRRAARRGGASHRLRAPCRHRIRHRASRRQLLRAHQRHRPQLPAGEGRCGQARPRPRRGADRRPRPGHAR